ncbi:ABC transporter ATP-binding protein [Streptomyces edwardsiae]|uniref:ABC transporter ATP-binding protein n=1 Tax=Streptomyces edwardsiae TaxID=3075527 RepID=A0ABU2PPL5_9ACTN|nr:ABC transporter ATP-binding protein [Streptomyces sp. DSM 41636]MDT0393619.1 ABC transporter ATP-binding protein [Streptomyces sp. DSM 41636]
MNAQPKEQHVTQSTTRSTPIVRIRGIEQHFGPVHALGPVDLTIERGEFVSIVGPSGCGKSTLLEIIGALQDPVRGSVEVDGTPLDGPRRRTAIVFQESATLPWRTVVDNVAFALEVRGVGRKERREHARELVEMVGLGGFENHYPAQLSGGMRQRVAMARAMSTDPDLILADEPFGALDEQTRMLMAEELLRVVESIGCGVLFITHSIQEAVLLSDRVLVMGRRPGTFIDEVPIELPRPRAHASLSEPSATASQERIWAQIRSEAEVAMVGTRSTR